MLKYVPGSKIGKPDNLSRRLDWEIGVEKNNKDETLVKPKWLEVRRTEVVEIIVDVEFRGYRTKVETCCKCATSLFSTTVRAQSLRGG